MPMTIQLEKFMVKIATSALFGYITTLG
uniref:Uncharacterized protein n=1 Tax=Arundo donax TaxID=35708 RepID=A0A0A9C039_ARUDO